MKKTHSDPERGRELGLPPDMPPLGEIESEMDVSPPRWKEVEAVVRKAKASSAPGPNGVPYRVYKNQAFLGFCGSCLRLFGISRAFQQRGVGQGEC